MPSPTSSPVVAGWRAWLRSERRVAERTRSGYDEDLGAFLAFMAGHRGGPVGLADLAALRLADFRAWLAWRHHEGYARTSTARAMAAVRGFFRYLDRRHGVHNPALQAMRTPRLPHRVPRPLAESGRARSDPDRPHGARASPGWACATRHCCCCSTAPACASARRCR